jgi:H+/Cl- antiporter ClcA
VDHSKPATNPAREGGTIGGVGRVLILASAVGVLAGLSSAVFLVALDRATEVRLDHPWLIWLLPVAGLAIGAAYHYGGGSSGAGNNLILDEIHEPRAWVPRRMAPMILVGTVATHVVGGSAGREGTAIQMAGSLADGLHRRLGITGTERRLLLLAAIGGGFSAVFGVPFAGVAFALEVQAIGRLRWQALAPVAVAAAVGHLVVIGLGVHHLATPTIVPPALTAALGLKLVLAAAAFGLTALVFAEAIHRTKGVLARAVTWPPARPVLGGFALLALTAGVGTRDYLGLSLPLIADALAGGTGVALGAFALKALFTAVTLGSGFQGGEVTPLFVIGATLGATLGNVLDVPIPFLAALGFVAVFAGATNTPLACAVMGIELFGWPMAPWLLPMCIVAAAASGPGGIYTSQQPVRWGFRHQPSLPSRPPRA